MGRTLVVCFVLISIDLSLLLLTACGTPTPTPYGVMVSPTATLEATVWKAGDFWPDWIPSNTVVYPTPALTPASEFVDGQVAVPDGKALLLEFRTTIREKGDCGCCITPLEGTFMPYNFRSQLLVQRQCARLGTSYTEIKPIATLPYTFSPCSGRDPKITIRSVSMEGRVVVEIDGTAVWLESGEGWYHSEDLKYPNACEVTIHGELFNRGLLDEGQITVDGFHPGVPELDVAHLD